MPNLICTIVRALACCGYLFCTIYWLCYQGKSTSVCYYPVSGLIASWVVGLVLLVVPFCLSSTVAVIVLTVASVAWIAVFLLFLRHDVLTPTGLRRYNMLGKATDIPYTTISAYGNYKWWSKKYTCYVKEVVVFQTDGAVHRFTGKRYEQVGKTLAARHIVTRRLVGPSKEKPTAPHPWQKQTVK